MTMTDTRRRWIITTGLQIYIKISGHDHPDVATTKENIGIVYERQGQYEESVHLLEEARNIRIKVHGFHHPSLAQSLLNKASQD